MESKGKTVHTCLSEDEKLLVVTKGEGLIELWCLETFIKVASYTFEKEIKSVVAFDK